MMSDKEFAELELRATICPQQCRWPAPEYLPLAAPARGRQ